jgi:hypothetical protein
MEMTARQRKQEIAYLEAVQRNSLRRKVTDYMPEKAAEKK